MKRIWTYLLAILMIAALAAPAAASTTQTRCACGVTTSGTVCTDCGSAVYGEWKAWDLGAGNSILLSGTVQYYLTSDLVLDGEMLVADNANITIDLNGYDIIAGANRFSRYGIVDFYKDGTNKTADATVTITDSSAANTGELLVAGQGSNQNGGNVVRLTNKNNTCKLINVGVRMTNSLDATTHSNTKNSVMFSVPGDSTLSIYNAKIDASNVTAGYGVIAVIDGTVTIDGANTVITGGTATTTGGGAFLVQGNGGAGLLELKNGTIQNGKYTGGHGTGKGGGNINVFNNWATFTMTGGTVRGGEAIEGGNVFSVSLNFTMSGGVIENGVATSTDITCGGGNVCLQQVNVAPKFTMTGGTIRNGAATNSSGGNISVPSGVFNLQNGMLTGGSAKRGGAFCVTGGTVNITGGTINSGTSAQGHGCGCVDSGTFTITGGTVAGVFKFGGTVNVSGTPSMAIALANNQYFNIPANITAGARITVNADDWSDDIAVAASNAIAMASKPYIGPYANALSIENGVRLHLAAVRAYKNGASDGYWMLNTRKGGPGYTYKLMGNITLDALQLYAGTVLDLNGFTLTVNGTAALDGVLLVDSATADYDSSTGYGKLRATTVEGSLLRAGVDAMTQYRYATILDSNGDYSAHRIYITIKSAVLAPGGPSVNFRTVFKCDQTIAALVEEYGAAFVGKNTVISKCTNPILTGNSNQNPWLTKLSNASAKYFENSFSAQAYIVLNDNWTVAEEKTVTSSSMTRSIKDMVEYANTNFSALTVSQQKAVAAMFQRFNDSMAKGWKISGIAKYVSANSAQVWTDGTLPTTNGYYVLNQSYQLTATAKPADNATIWLDLNGQTITGPAGRIYDFTDVTGASVVVYDSTTEQNGTLAAPNTCKTPGGIVNLTAGNTFMLLSGTLDGSLINLTASGSGSFGAAINALGNVYIHGGTVKGGQVNGGLINHGGGAVAISGADTQLHMTAGNIEGGFTICGGAVMVQQGATFTMDGGTITGAKASYDGGNVFVWNATFNLNGGTVSGGTLGAAARHGTNVCIWDASNFNMNGGTISGGTASRTDGKAYGGVYVGSQAAMSLSGGAKITGNIYNGKASNLYLGGGTLTVEENGMNKNASVGITLAAGNGAFATGSGIDATAAKSFTHDDGLNIVFAGNGAPLHCGSYGLRAGYARCDITPQEILPIDSGGVTPPKPDKWQIISNLYATVVVLVDDRGIDNAVVLCTMDTLYADDQFVEAAAAVVAEKLGIPKGNVFFSASHTHAGPDLDYGDFAMDSHVKRISNLIADAACTAVKDLQPTTLRVGAKELPGLNATRRFVLKETQPNGRKVQSAVGTTITLDMIDTNGPYGGYESAPDRQIQAILLQRAGTDIALVNWQVHPGYDGASGGISSDYIGALRASIEGTDGETAVMEDTVCAFFCGAGGNLNRSSILETENRSLTKAEYGRKLAQGVADALKNGTDVAAGPIKLAHDTYTNTFKNWYPANNLKAPLSIGAISVGDVALITAPYEMFCENGVQIKSFAKDSDLFKMTFICANTNGNRRYIPSQTAFDGDPDMETFEVHYAPFGAGAAEELVGKYQTLLQQVAGE